MSEEATFLPENISQLTPDQILQLLDSGWPWPLDAVQTWFEALWQMILYYFNQIAGWVYNRVKPAIDQVYYWINSAISSIISGVSSYFYQVWGWINSAISSITASVTTIVNAIYGWVISARDWLWSQISSAINSVLSWVTTQVSQVSGWITREVTKVWDWLVSVRDWLWANIQPLIQSVATTLKSSWDIFVPQLQKVVQEVLSTWWDTFIGRFLDFPSWVGLLFDAISAWVTRDVPGKSPWWQGMLDSLLEFFIGKRKPDESTLDYVIEAFGTFLSFPFRIPYFWDVLTKVIVSAWNVIIIALKPVAAIAVDIFTGFMTGLETYAHPVPLSESTPGKIKDMLTSVTTSVFAGLTAMTLAGELTVFGSKIGLGQISAMIYDLTNFKVLTGAFVGVLAVVMVKTPLEYYYNTVFRPNLPNERELGKMLSQQDITPNQFRQYMPYHGLADEWIEREVDSVYRALSPFIIAPIAQAIDLPPKMIDYWVKLAGYGPQFAPYIQKWIDMEKAAAVKTMSTSVAITRFREGFDTEDQFRQNLLGLGVDKAQLNRYVFAANLSYLTDYQTDLLNWYKESYHRRDINDTQFLESLTSLGLPSERIDAIYEREKLKRLKVTTTPAPVVKTLTAAQVGALYKQGKLTQDDALGRLGTYFPIASDRVLFLMLYEPLAPELPPGS